MRRRDAGSRGFGREHHRRRGRGPVHVMTRIGMWCFQASSMAVSGTWLRFCNQMERLMDECLAPAYAPACVCCNCDLFVFVVCVSVLDWVVFGGA